MKKINPDIEEILLKAGDPPKIRQIVTEILNLELQDATRRRGVQDEIVNIVDGMEFDVDLEGDKNDNN